MLFQVYAEVKSLVELCRVQLKVVQLNSNMLANDLVGYCSKFSFVCCHYFRRKLKLISAPDTRLNVFISVLFLF